MAGSGVSASSVPSIRWQRVCDGARTVFGLALLGVGGCLWTLVALPLYYLLPRGVGLRLGRGLIQRGFRAYLRIAVAIGGCRLELDALDALADADACIIAPNHPSLLDAVLVISRIPSLGCIMKSRIVDNPAFGAGARLARYIRNDDLSGMVRLAVADLRAGHPLLLFPEGTRSRQRPISPVHGSIGLIARQAQVPVQTVLIETDSPFLAKGWPLWRIPHLPITYRLRLGRRFPPPDDMRGFAAELDAYFRAELAGAMLPAPLQPEPMASEVLGSVPATSPCAADAADTPR
jgi:1-acyl-sn-glycerol-3-phosphate acyltransferase